MKIPLLIAIYGFSIPCLSQINKSLKNELLEIYSKDQNRAFFISDSDFMQKWNKQVKVDSINLVRVSTILDSIGFPGKSMVGDTANKATFFVIQHASLKYQEKYLPIFLNAAKKNEIEWNFIAMMIDRIKVNKNEKQIYGTQLQYIKNPKNGCITDKLEFAPIEDAENVNNRRQGIGLNTIEEYAKGLGIKYELKK